jgi:hypothetical protein
MGQRIRRILNLDPDPARPSWHPKKEEKVQISCLKSLNVLCRGLIRHTVHDGFDKKNFPIINLKKKLFIINLDLDPDRIRMQQNA